MAPTTEQKVLLAMLREMTIEDLVPVLNYALCDYHKRLLAVAMVYPEDHECTDEGHAHTDSEEDQLADKLMVRASGKLQ